MTHLSPRAIEAGAKAIEGRLGFKPGFATEISVAVLTALEAEGMVVVPKVPTEAMLSAGDSMMPQIAPGQDITTGYDALKEAWPAALQAAQGGDDAGQ